MILVTGAAGFIGSVLLAELNKLGREDIIIVDQLKDSSKWQNLKNKRFIDYFQIDEIFEEKNLPLLKRVNQIYHLGANSSTLEEDMDLLWENNVRFSQQIFNFATQNNVDLVYASSAATYGAGDKGYNDSHQSIKDLIPLNRYAFSKHFFDQWVLNQPRQPNRWLGLKFFNVYGPNEYHKGGMRSMVKQAFEQIQEHHSIRLFKSYLSNFSDGEQARDFIYVKDVSKIMVRMMESNHNIDNGIYNLGTGKARSFNDLGKAVFKACGEAEKFEYIEMPSKLKKAYQYFTQANMDKFNQAFPFTSFHSLEEGIEDYIKNFLMKDDPYL